MGSDEGSLHESWYRLLARYYDEIAEKARSSKRASDFLHARLRRRGARDILDVACGTFSVDVHLMRRGYRVTGLDASPAMLRIARRNARLAGFRPDLEQGDMRSLRLDRTFDAVVCIGTAFNYLASIDDVRRSLRSFYVHLRPGGVLVLDLTNFDAWIRDPMNVLAEVDHQAKDGTRIAIFSFNAQDRRRHLHFARFITALERGGRLDLSWSEAPLRIWDRQEISTALRHAGFRPREWRGDLRPRAPYRRRSSPRLVVVAERGTRPPPGSRDDVRRRAGKPGTPSRRASTR